MGTNGDKCRLLLIEDPALEAQPRHEVTVGVFGPPPPFKGPKCLGCRGQGLHLGAPHGRCSNIPLPLDTHTHTRTMRAPSHHSAFACCAKAWLPQREAIHWHTRPFSDRQDSPKAQSPKPKAHSALMAPPHPALSLTYTQVLSSVDALCLHPQISAYTRNYPPPHTLIPPSSRPQPQHAPGRAVCRVAISSSCSYGIRMRAGRWDGGAIAVTRVVAGTVFACLGVCGCTGVLCTAA